MIVVDTNVIQYCWVRGQHTEVAQAVRQKDPDWHVPMLWRSEIRNVLTAYLRRELLSRPQIARILLHEKSGQRDPHHEHEGA